MTFMWFRKTIYLVFCLTFIGCGSSNKWLIKEYKFDGALLELSEKYFYLSIMDSTGETNFHWGVYDTIGGKLLLQEITGFSDRLESVEMSYIESVGKDSLTVESSFFHMKDVENVRGSFFDSLYYNISDSSYKAYGSMRNKAHTIKLKKPNRRKIKISVSSNKESLCDSKSVNTKRYNHVRFRFESVYPIESFNFEPEDFFKDSILVFDKMYQVKFENTHQ